MPRLLSAAFVAGLVAGLSSALAQSPAAPPQGTPPPRAPRPPSPTRDPHTAGYVKAKELPDGENPSPDVDGNFIIGATHNPAPEMTVKESVPKGTIYNFEMDSADSKIYPGIARDPRDPNEPGKISIHPQPYKRPVAVYVPKQYVAGTTAPFIVGADGPDPALFTALDNLIAEHKCPS